MVDRGFLVGPRLDPRRAMAQNVCREIESMIFLGTCRWWSADHRNEAELADRYWHPVVDPSGEKTAARTQAVRQSCQRGWSGSRRKLNRSLGRYGRTVCLIGLLGTGRMVCQCVPTCFVLGTTLLLMTSNSSASAEPIRLLAVARGVAVLEAPVG
jgi:hypothetical protein